MVRTHVLYMSSSSYCYIDFTHDSWAARSSISPYTDHEDHFSPIAHRQVQQCGFNQMDGFNTPEQIITDLLDTSMKPEYNAGTH
jgi:hypothetical protein